MKFGSKLLNLLSNLDFFQQTVSLSLKNRNRISLLSGKLISIGIIFFVIYNVFESNMIKKINPIVMERSIEDNNDPEIFLTQQNFRLF